MNGIEKFTQKLNNRQTAFLKLYLDPNAKEYLNGTRAYMKIYHAGEKTAAANASETLRNTNVSAILDWVGLDDATIGAQLKEGSKAEKWNEFTGEKVPDHKTRLDFLKTALELKGRLKNQNQLLQQFNVGGDMSLEFIKQ